MASHAGRRNEGPADPSYEREPRRYPPSHQAFQRQQQQQQQPPQHYPNRPLPHPSEEVPFQDGLSQPRQNGPPQHNHLHRRRPDGPLLQSHNGNYNQTSNTSSRRRRRWSDMTRTIAHYERIEQIGEGTYGQVYMAKCKDTNEIVAMKKIRVHHGAHWGMPPTVIREIKILKTLVHPNLVKMHEVVSSKGVEHLDADDYHKGSDRSRKKHKLKTAASDGKLDASDSNKNETRTSNNHSSTVEKSNDNTNNNNNSKYATDVADARESYKGNLFLVLEYVPHDLTGLLDVAYKFREVEIKCIFKQLLQALQYMHEQKYVHRDIKSSNILIDRHFRLKLADFGLARSIEPPLLDKLHDRGNSQDFTNKVITLWYRPPELLLGATKYGAAVDIWSAGCILAELILGKPLFTGKTEMDQLQLIFDMVGTPTPKSWPGIQDLKLLRTGDVSIDASSSSSKRPKFRERYYSKMNAIAPGAMQLVEKLLELDPSKRLTASRALNHRYFMAEPQAPELPEMLGEMKLAEGGSFHEFQTKKKRKEAKAQAEKVKQAALDGGHTAKEAQEEYDAVYRGIMEKVAMEGLKTEKPAEEPEIPSKSERSNSKHRERSSTNGSKHKSRESSRSQKDRRSSTRERSHRDGSEKTRERKSRDDKTTDRERLRSSDRRSSETETKRRSRESSLDRDKKLSGGTETVEANSSALEGSGKAPEQAPPPAKEPQKDIPAKDASGPPDTDDPSSKTDTERRKKDDTNPTKDETKDQQRSHRSSEKKRSKDRSREGEKRHHRDRDHRKRSSRDGHDEDRDRSSRKSASSSKRRKHHRDRSRSRSPPSDYRSGRGMEDHPRDRPRGDRRSYMDDPHDDRRIFPPRDGHPMSRGFPSPPRGGPPRGPPRGGEYPPYGRGPPYDDRGPRGGFYDRPPPEGYPRGPSRPPPRDYYDGIPPGHRDREGRRDRDRRDRR